MRPLPLYSPSGRVVARVAVPSVPLLWVSWRGRVYLAHADGRHVESPGYAIPVETGPEPEGRLQRKDED